MPSLIRPQKTTKTRPPKPWEQHPTSRRNPTPSTAPLPLLPHHDHSDEVVDVTVLERPTVGEWKGLTWIADERPKKQVGTDSLISLRVGGRKSGVGRMATIIDMRKHWITWSLTGGQTKCAIRLPTSWTDLTGIESAAHTRVYRSLPENPAPHRDFANLATTTNETQSPYEFNSNEEHDDLMTRINHIIRPKRGRAIRARSNKHSSEEKERMEREQIER